MPRRPVSLASPPALVALAALVAALLAMPGCVRITQSPSQLGEDDGSAGTTQAKKKGETVEETFASFKHGMSFDEIEKLRNLSPSTKAAHMKRLVQASRDN